MVKIKKTNIKYYDSDTVAAISNLARLPLNGSKSKERLLNVIRRLIVAKLRRHSHLNRFILTEKTKVDFLYHEIRNDIPHYEKIIRAKNLVSVQIVKPKLTNTRVINQKGAFLLFGLNYEDHKKCIPIIKDNKLQKSTQNINTNPIESILKITISNSITTELLDKIGIKQPCIYPEMEKISEYFKEKGV